MMTCLFLPVCVQPQQCMQALCSAAGATTVITRVDKEWATHSQSNTAVAKPVFSRVTHFAFCISQLPTRFFLAPEFVLA